MIGDVGKEIMISVVYLSTVSAICGGMGPYILWKRMSLFARANRAIGYFVRWEQRGLRKMHYYPVVRFQAMDGKEYEFIGEPGTSTKKQTKHYSVLYVNVQGLQAIQHHELKRMIGRLSPAAFHEVMSAIKWLFDIDEIQ